MLSTLEDEEGIARIPSPFLLPLSLFHEASIFLPPTLL